MERVLLGLGSAMLLFACVKPEETAFAFRPNTTNQQKADHWLDCRIEAARAVPVSTQIGTTPTYTTPVTVSPSYTNCTGYGASAICTTTGGYISGGQLYGGQTYSYDANAELRESYQYQCMRKKGYSLVSLPVCSADQVPEGLTASMKDRIVDPSGSSCAAITVENVAVPVRVKK